MTGAEQYDAAEVLLTKAKSEASEGVLGIAAVTAAAAQVHATLALAAAVEKQTRYATGLDTRGYGTPDDTRWERTA